MTEIYVPDRFTERVLVRQGGHTVAIDPRRGIDLLARDVLFPGDLVWSGHDERDLELDKVHEDAYDEGADEGYRKGSTEQRELDRTAMLAMVGDLTAIDEITALVPPGTVTVLVAQLRTLIEEKLPEVANGTSS